MSTVFLDLDDGECSEEPQDTRFIVFELYIVGPRLETTLLRHSKFNELIFHGRWTLACALNEAGNFVDSVRGYESLSRARR